MDELLNTDPDFDQEVTKQNNALLEIINKTINNAPVETNEFDLKKNEKSRRLSNKNNIMSY